MDHSTLSDTEADPQRPVGAPAQDTSPEQERVRRTVVFHDRETMVRSIGQADSALTQIELARPGTHLRAHDLTVSVDGRAEDVAVVVALLARLLEGHFRVTANGNALLLAQPSEAEVPLLGPSGGDEQHQAVRIVEGVVFAGGLGLPDDGIG